MSRVSKRTRMSNLGSDVIRVAGQTLCAALLVLVGSMGLPPAEAQESTTAALAEELVGLLADRELDAIAASDTVDDDRYVAALAFPGQLLVVSARYEAPAATERKLGNGEYREVYIDLNAASIAGTKILITDSGANGLHADDDFVDVFNTDSGTLRFDGDRSGGSMSGEDYRSAFADADLQYARMLSALITQAR